MSKKLLKNEDDAELIKLFIAEIKMLRKLTHPNIIRVCGAVAEPLAAILEHMTFDFTPYGAKGVTVTNLSQFLKKLHKHKAVDQFHNQYDVFHRITADTANGLSYLHNEGIAHRDLKPGNILVGNTQHGKVSTNKCITCKITDFGEAKAYSIRTNSNAASRTNVSDKGTLPYQAPEIVLEKLTTAKLVDLRRMDIWAFGCVVFCMLNADLSYPYAKECQVGDQKLLRKLIAQCMTKQLLPQHSDSYTDLKQSLRDLEDIMETSMTFEPMERPDIYSVVKLVIIY